MALVKRRPELALLAPKRITTGRPFRLRAVLTCREAVPVDGVTIELTGEGIFHTANHARLPFARYVAQVLRGRQELEAGEHELEGVFELPAQSPSSYAGERFRIEWSARVHVDIAWWPDARATYPLWVRDETPPEPDERRRVFASSVGGPRGRKPYVEVSLGSTRLEPGGQVVGRAALGNTADNVYRALRFALVGVETFPLGTDHNRVAAWTVPIERPVENDPIAFALKLPADLVPSFRTRELGLAWFLEARIDVAWAIDTRVWIPVDVRVCKQETIEETRRPLAVGSERLALVWGHAARQTGFNYLDGEISREVDVCRLTIRREQGRRGLRLVAQARFPDIDLGLRSVRGRLRVRDEQQSHVLGEHTDAAAAASAVTHADDEHIRCELDDAGTRVETVAAFAQDFEQLVRAFVLARSELPAPADMADRVPELRAAARRLGGALDIASMDVRGHREEMCFSLETQWDDDGSLARTVLEVRPLMPIDGRHQQTWEARDGSEALPLGLAPLVGGAVGVVIEQHALRIVFPPRPDDFDALVDRLEGLIEIGLRLSGRGLGYR